MSEDQFVDMILELGLGLIVPATDIKRIYTELCERKVTFDPSPPGQAAMAAYFDIYTVQYGHRPIVEPMYMKRLKQLTTSIGTESMIKLLRTYLSMKDSQFIHKRHDIPTFIFNISKVQDYQSTGRDYTQGELRQLDKKMTNANAVDGAIQRIRERNGK